MTSERTVLRLADMLEVTGILLDIDKKPPKSFKTEAKWLIYNVRQDIEKGRLEFQGLVPEAKVKELERRILDLENEVESLEDQLDASPDQDVLDELESENEDLRRREDELKEENDGLRRRVAELEVNK